MMSLNGLPGRRRGGDAVGHPRRSHDQTPPATATPTAKPFVYRDLGSMATISRFRAIVSFKGIKVGGFIGWLMWAFVHLTFLTGFKNRWIALFKWLSAFVGKSPGRAHDHDAPGLRPDHRRCGPGSSRARKTCRGSWTSDAAPETPSRSPAATAPRSARRGRAARRACRARARGRDRAPAPRRPPARPASRWVISSVARSRVTRQQVGDDRIRGRRVEMLAGLVEDEHGEVGEQGPGDRQALALAAGHARAALAHLRAQPRGQPLGPVEQSHRGEGRAQLLGASPGVWPAAGSPRACCRTRVRPARPARRPCLQASPSRSAISTPSSVTDPCS